MGIGIQSCLGSIEHKELWNADAFAGIAKPARASVSISIDTPMNAKARDSSHPGTNHPDSSHPQ